MSRKTTDARQLDLFGGVLPADDPVATYYRRLRRAGVWLTLDPENGEVHASSDTDAVPAWAHWEALIHQDRIKSDVAARRARHHPVTWARDAGRWRRADPATGLSAARSAGAPDPAPTVGTAQVRPESERSFATNAIRRRFYRCLVLPNSGKSMLSVLKARTWPPRASSAGASAKRCLAFCARQRDYRH
jgi:hypothetical protein